MLRWICASCAVLALSGSAFAQKPGDHPAKALKGPDVNVIKEAVNTVKQPGECTVVFTIGKDGKPKDMKPTCTVDGYLPYVERAMATVQYDPEIFDGEVFETDGIKQPFKFGVAAAAPASSDKPPVVTVGLDKGDVERAIARANTPGVCNLSYTVGVDGKAKNIKPDCTPAKLDHWIADAVGNMRFTPGVKDGKPVDWDIAPTPMTLKKN